MIGWSKKLIKYEVQLCTSFNILSTIVQVNKWQLKHDKLKCVVQDLNCKIVLWCNGSTTVFGSVSESSNLPGTTKCFHGEIGRRSALKMLCPLWRMGSIPIESTYILIVCIINIVRDTSYFIFWIKIILYRLFLFIICPCSSVG